MKKIYITRKIPEERIQPFSEKYAIEMWPHEHQPIDQDTLNRKIAEADGLLTLLTDPVNEETLSSASNLKVIANLAVGFDNIDITAAKKRNIIVTNTPNVLTETTADLTFALLLSTARRIVEAQKFVEEGKWENWSPYLLAGSDIYQKTIGIVGMGRIGEAVAKRAAGFGMKILYHNRSRKERAEKQLGVRYVEFDELLKTSDFVVCLVPFTPKTKRMFGAKAFHMMKQSAIFINVSRGQNVDEHALYHALVNGEIKGCGLDVFEQEPIKKDHPLLQLDQVVCLPHIGSASIATRTTMIDLCLENIDFVLSGLSPKTPV
ncbi:2-hydroxyacid dehydrogenase [Aquibacillus salsiterrae]|uniref:D-glycerate dehydrogenase n=1 Tax=Aquibacillus salsiterrae TaxID=2950439 RepID=A0A9X3WI72_9BACI|nr:D-glycerate dehydrogenase [Aquibacillus salsiterrae]MDC3417844.1 D-glycerate dehydrogenase [Aquibacillus salsiterrae]